MSANPFNFGPEVPPAPIEVPTPDIPPANFATIGGQLASGAKSSGFLDGIWGGLLDIIAQLIGKIVGALLGLIEVVLAYVLSIFNKIWSNAEGGTDQIAAQAVSGLFGVPVSAPSFTSLNNPAARAALSSQVAGAILGALAPGATNTTGGTLQPSSDGATKFINTATHLAIEGWLQGWIAEVVSAGQIETFAELKDIMAHVLGLGRIAHTVIGPALKVLSTDPFLWQLNNAYRPHLMDPGTVVREILRGIGDATQLKQQLAWQGYSDVEIEALVNLGQVHLSAGDLQKLVDHQVLSNDDALNKLAAAGYDQWTANAAMEIQRVRESDALYLEIARVAVEGVAQRKLDPNALDSIISNFGLPSQTVQALKNLAALRLQLNVQRPSIGEALEMLEAGLYSLDDYSAILRYHGFQEPDITNMELLALFKSKKITDAATAKAAKAQAASAAAKAASAAKAAKAQAALAAAEARGVSVAEFQALVKSGLKTIAQYQQYLTAKGIAADNVAALVEEFNAQLQATAAKTAATASAAATVKARNLSLAQLQSAAKAGIITVAEYEQRLIESGVATADAQILGELLSDQIQTAATKAAAAAQKKATGAAKGIDLAQEELAVKLGLQTVADYAQFLQGRGYDASDVALLVSELQAQLNTLKQAAATKSTKAAATQARGLNLSQVEKEVRAGLKTIDDYRAALSAAGYDQPSADSLVALLQLQLDADQRTLAASGKAQTLLAQRGLSLSQLANAVTLGVLPMTAYTDALTRSGISAADVNTLQLALAAKIAKAAKGTTSSASATKLVSDAGLSLATLEKDVVNGALALDDFNSLLTTAGVSADDIAAIDSLVTAQQQHQQQLAALTGSVAASAKQRGLSLSEETSAVKNGVKTLADYSAFVASLGFDPADVQTLTATLAAELAKSSKTSSGAAPAAG